jgi:uncharacterized protein (DUF58 family)
VPTKRGWAAITAGLSLWIASRFLGSNDLHMLAAGIVVVPLMAALFVRVSKVHLEVRRNLSAVRVFPGTRVVVSITVENRGPTTVPFLLLEDGLPAVVGRNARLVVTGIPGRHAQTVSYSMVCRQRGTFTIGPLSVHVTDPFGLARASIQAVGQSELIVYPEVEDIPATGLATQGMGAGESAVRHLFRSAAEFYTMREYVNGDDLRRIHWPSVARTGRLMIRQDEATRRATAMLFLDNRTSTLGRNGSPGFEKAVSVAATVGRALIQAGFALTLAMAETPPKLVAEEGLLETLAGAAPVRKRSVADSLTGLRGSAVSDSTLAIVMAPPVGTDVAGLSRLGSAFGRRVAVFVYPVPLSGLAPAAAADLEGRASAARVSLQRTGWGVYLVHADGTLAETWQSRPIPKAPAVARFS